MNSSRAAPAAMRATHAAFLLSLVFVGAGCGPPRYGRASGTVGALVVHDVEWNPTKAPVAISS